MDTPYRTYAKAEEAETWKDYPAEAGTPNPWTRLTGLVRKMKRRKPGSTTRLKPVLRTQRHDLPGLVRKMKRLRAGRTTRLKPVLRTHGHALQGLCER
jgi:hypothetical protein